MSVRSSQVTGVAVPVKTYTFAPEVWEQGAAPPRGVGTAPGENKDRTMSRAGETIERKDRSTSANKTDSLASSRLAKSPAPFNSTSKGRLDDKPPRLTSSQTKKRKPPAVIPEEGVYRPDLDEIALKVVRLEGVVTPNCNIENFVQDSRAVKQRLQNEGGQLARFTPEDILKHNDQLTFDSMLITDVVEPTNSMPKSSHNLNKALQSKPVNPKQPKLPDQVLLTKPPLKQQNLQQTETAEIPNLKVTNPNFRIQPYDPKYDSEEFVQQIIQRDTGQVPSLKTAGNITKQKKTLKEKAEEIYNKDLEELRLNKMMVAKQEQQLKSLPKPQKSSTTVTPLTKAKQVAVEKLKAELAKARAAEDLYEDPNEDIRGSFVEDDVKEKEDAITVQKGELGSKKDGKDRGRGGTVAREDQMEEVVNVVPPVEFDLAAVDAGDQAIGKSKSAAKPSNTSNQNTGDPQPGELGTEGELVLDLQGFGSTNSPMLKEKENPQSSQKAIAKPKTEPAVAELELDVHADSEFEDDPHEDLENPELKSKANVLPEEPQENGDLEPKLPEAETIQPVVADEEEKETSPKIGKLASAPKEDDAKEGDIVMELPMIEPEVPIDPSKKEPTKEPKLFLPSQKARIAPKNEDEDDLPINSDIDARFLEEYEFKYNDKTGVVEKVPNPPPPLPAEAPIPPLPAATTPAPKESLASALKQAHESHLAQVASKYSPALTSIEQSLQQLKARLPAAHTEQTDKKEEGVMKSKVSGHLRVGMKGGLLVAWDRIEAVQEKLRHANTENARVGSLGSEQREKGSVQGTGGAHGTIPKSKEPDLRGARERMASLLNDLEKDFDKDWADKYNKKSSTERMNEDTRTKENPFDLERLKKMSLDELHKRNTKTGDKRVDLPIELDPRLALEAMDPNYSMGKSETKSKKVQFAPKPPLGISSKLPKASAKGSIQVPKDKPITTELDESARQRILNSIVKPNTATPTSMSLTSQIVKHPWIDFD